jgi:hypothetical protein
MLSQLFKIDLYQSNLEWPFTGGGWDSSFDPTSELCQNGLDIELALLTFNGAYDEATDNPWFSAYQQVMLNATSRKATHSKSFV